MRGGVRQRLAKAASEFDSEEAQADNRATRQRGGVHQRLRCSACDSNEVVDDPKTGPLYRSLKKDWGSGVLSSSRVQEYAAGAKAQGAEGLDRLVNIGCSGKYQGNLYRDILSVFG